MKKTLSAFAIILYRNFAAFCNERLQAIGLSQGMLYFIIYIGKHPCCSPAKLAKELHMDLGHTQRSVDKLVSGGFVLREKNENDKRAYVLNLTEKGLTAFETIYNLFNEWDEIAFEDISLEERNALLLVLEKLYDKKGGFICVRNN